MATLTDELIVGLVRERVRTDLAATAAAGRGHSACPPASASVGWQKRAGHIPVTESAITGPATCCRTASSVDCPAR